jgi:hypothetical protein
LQSANNKERRRCWAGRQWRRHGRAIRQGRARLEDQREICAHFQQLLWFYVLSVHFIHSGCRPPVRRSTGGESAVCLSEVNFTGKSVINSGACFTHVPGTSLSLAVGLVFIVEHYRQSLDNYYQISVLYICMHSHYVAIFVTVHFYEILICCQFHRFEKQDNVISLTRRNAPSIHCAYLGVRSKTSIANSS